MLLSGLLLRYVHYQMRNLCRSFMRGVGLGWRDALPWISYGKRWSSSSRAVLWPSVWHNFPPCRAHKDVLKQKTTRSRCCWVRTKFLWKGYLINCDTNKPFNIYCCNFLAKQSDNMSIIIKQITSINPNFSITSNDVYSELTPRKCLNSFSPFVTRCLQAMWCWAILWRLVPASQNKLILWNNERRQKSV